MGIFQNCFYTFSDSMAARVFKVMHDKERGALSVIRMLNGTLKEGDKIKTSSDHEEVVREIYEPFADDYLRIHSIGEGNVAICSGLTVNLQHNYSNLFRLIFFSKIIQKCNNKRLYFIGRLHRPVIFLLVTWRYLRKLKTSYA